MKGNRKAAIAVRTIALTLALMLLAGSALASMKAYVYSDSMRVYKKASSSSDRMGSLEADTAFYITDYNSSWCKIYYKGYTGYVRWKDVILDEDDRIKCYTSEKAAMYKGPSSSYGKMGTVAAGTVAYLAGRSGS